MKCREAVGKAWRAISRRDSDAASRKKVQFVLTGLQRGLLVDTAVKAALIKAVLFGVVLRSLISWKSWRTLAQGSPMGIVPCVDPECHGMTMLFACVALATAEMALLSLELLLLLFPVMVVRRRTLEVLPLLDSVYLLLLQWRKFSGTNYMSRLRPGLSVEAGMVSIFGLVYALSFAASPSRFAKPAGAALAVLVAVGLVVGQTVVQAQLGFRHAPGIVGIFLKPVLWAVFCFASWVLCSPRPSAHPHHHTSSSLPTGHGQISLSRSSPTEALSLGQGTARSRSLEVSIASPAGAKPESASPLASSRQHVEDKAQKPFSWIGRIQAAIEDDILMLRVLFPIKWLTFAFIIAVVVWMQTSETNEKILRHALCVLGVQQHKIPWNSTAWCPDPPGALDNVMATLVVWAFFLAFGVGIRMARVTAIQRDTLLADVVPKEVADTLVHEFARQQTGGAGGGVLGALARTARTASYPLPVRNPPSLEKHARPAEGRLASNDHARVASDLSAVPRSHSEMQLARVHVDAGPGGTSARRRSKAMSVNAGQANHAEEPQRVEQLNEPQGGVVSVPFVGHEEQTGLVYFREHDDVSLMFSDLVSFTEMASTMPARDVLQTLHAVFSMLDRVSDALGAHKYETVGDAYISVSNLLRPEENHRLQALRMGVTLVRAVSATRVTLPDGRVHTLQARVGLHTGPVAAGVLGLKRRVMSLVGDTVNTASRMESAGLPGHVQASQFFYDGLPEGVQKVFFPRDVEIKGKGRITVWAIDVLGNGMDLERLGLDITAQMLGAPAGA